jgi:hypothetical protein
MTATGYRWPLVHSLLRSAGSTVVMLTVYYLAPLDHARSTSALVVLGLGLVVFAGLLGWQIRSISHARHPRLRAVESLSVAIPLLLIVFAGTYLLMRQDNPGSFSEPLNHTDALYFTVTVFTTVGFGDIVPVTGAARAVTTVQMLVDLFVFGVIARVIFGAVQSGLRRTGSPSGPTP